MKPTEIDWRSGIIDYWDLDFLDLRQDMAAQAEYLKEDLAQVKYSSDVLLDIGWYPEFSPSGEFVVTVIRGGDWESPLFQGSANSVQALLTCLVTAVVAADSEK
ncbi:hypothetical protein [Pelomonas sp. BJYL3]|uniref:hypothetical protein n=1 Tax=Pelomonas sp. BJYL3 TaxID=2976697 RepID=UPI0022B422F6|nr:hypothetical protein [Pelomonas sp. BJYL3]